MIAERLGYQPYFVWLSPDGGGVCCAFDPLADTRDPLDELEVLVAGAAAEARYLGCWDWRGAETDVATAVDLVLLHSRIWRGRGEPLRAAAELARSLRREMECDHELWARIVVRAEELSARYADHYGLTS